MANNDDPPMSTLITQAVGGDQQASASLLLRNLPMLEAYVRLHAGAKVRQKESLSDLVQSVCVEVLQDLPKFQFRGEPQFRHWLCKQALHKIINKNEYYQAKKRDMGRERSTGEGGSSVAGPASLQMAYASVMTPSRVVSGREAVVRFEGAFDLLPEDYRQAITLQRLVGLDYAQIAAEMDRSEGAVRNLVYRGLARLSALLDDEATG